MKAKADKCLKTFLKVKVKVNKSLKTFLKVTILGVKLLKHLLKVNCDALFCRGEIVKRNNNITIVFFWLVGVVVPPLRFVGAKL